MWKRLVAPGNTRASVEERAGLRYIGRHDFTRDADEEDEIEAVSRKRRMLGKSFGSIANASSSNDEQNSSLDSKQTRRWSWRTAVQHVRHGTKSRGEIAGMKRDDADVAVTRSLWEVEEGDPTLSLTARNSKFCAGFSGNIAGMYGG
eukprot:GHVU01081956.1.p1 GENE.GHVU01081956.1~~GHVU01081956.1.p1  ORF type:complete len:147 (+),score=15.28 GHVU01081956.1:264-704(+)